MRNKRERGVNMLLLVTHTHTPERCPGVKNAESGKEFLKSLSEEIASKESARYRSVKFLKI